MFPYLGKGEFDSSLQERNFSELSQEQPLPHCHAPLAVPICGWPTIHLQEATKMFLPQARQDAPLPFPSTF
jgi:hypothetical protein